MNASQERRSPRAAGFGSNSRLGGRDHSTSTTRPIDRLLPLLRDVRKAGSGLRADCPCGHRSKGSLSIAESDSGAVLLRCFSGCTPHDILACFGLQVADLFPVRIADPSPEARRAARAAFQRIGWEAALGVLAREATVVGIAARELVDGRTLSMDDHARLLQALERIESARDVLNGH